jgi:hypothetical protein
VANTVDLVRKLETRAGFIARRLALDLEAELRASAAPHKRTGQLEGAIKVRDARVSPALWRITATVPVPQAYWLESGRRSFKAKNPSGFLTFKDGRNGNWVRVREVRAAPATHWFTKVWNPAHFRVLLGRVTGV